MQVETGAQPSASKTPRHPLKIAGICSLGFEDFIRGYTSITFSAPEQEEDCDKRSLCNFLIMAGMPCDNLLPGEGYDPNRIKSFDVDKNGEVNCADYLAWKSWLLSEFNKGKRKTSGETLNVAACETDSTPFAR